MEPTVEDIRVLLGAMNRYFRVVMKWRKKDGWNLAFMVKATEQEIPHIKAVANGGRHRMNARGVCWFQVSTERTIRIFRAISPYADRPIIQECCDLVEQYAQLREARWADVHHSTRQLTDEELNARKEIKRRLHAAMDRKEVAEKIELPPLPF